MAEIDGLPLAFILPLAVHILAGMTSAVTGIVAFSVPKGPTRHHRWGTHYLWAYTVVFLTATVLSVQRWQADAYLFVLAMLGYTLALGGYSVRRFRNTPWLRRLLGEYWVIAHLVGMISSYVVLLTAFYVDNAHLFPGVNRLPTIVFWVAPTLVALPFLVRSIRRFLPTTATPSASTTSTPSATAGVQRDGIDRPTQETTIPNGS
jgi:uncharacterized membrane protein